MTAFTTRLITQAMFTAEGLRARAVRLGELADRLQLVHAPIGRALKDEAAGLTYSAGALAGAAQLVQDNPHSTGPFTVSTTVTRPGIVAWVMTGDGDVLCEVCDAGPRNMSINEARGNADHIVMCLNTHDALVAALTPLAETPTTSETPGVHADPDNDAMIYAARAAIAATRSAA